MNTFQAHRLGSNAQQLHSIIKILGITAQPT